jgi:hypothetical protein
LSLEVREKTLRAYRVSTSPTQPSVNVLLSVPWVDLSWRHISIRFQTHLHSFVTIV